MLFVLSLYQIILNVYGEWPGLGFEEFWNVLFFVPHRIFQKVLKNLMRTVRCLPLPLIVMSS